MLTHENKKQNQQELKEIEEFSQLSEVEAEAILLQIETLCTTLYRLYQETKQQEKDLLNQPKEKKQPHE